MPSHEAIVNTVLPQQVEKPIPTKTVQTRMQPRPHLPNINQPSTLVPPGAESSTPAESVKLSPQLSALARKEQAFRERERAFQEREKAMEQRLAEAEQYSQLKAKFSNKDYSAAEELGLSYDEYVQYKIDKAEGQDPYEEKFKALTKEIEDLKKGKEENANQEYEARLDEYRSEIASFVKDSDKAPRIRKAGEEAEKAILQLIVDSFEQDDLELSIEEATELVEKQLGELAKKWSALNEIDEPQERESQLPPPRQGIKTLTHAMQAGAQTAQPQVSLQKLSEAERYAEARRRALARRNG